MPKEILIYGSIHQFSAADFINSINELESSDDLAVRVNTGGGSPEYGFGMVAKIGEFEGNKSIKIDGKAFSWGAFSCLYVPAENIEALDVSEFMFHRAAYPSWFEKDAEFFTDEIKSNLLRMNKNLEKAMRNRIDVSKFEEITGTKIKDLFSMESRIDVFITAQDAKKIGLISKINKITPTKKAEIDSEMVSIAAKYETVIEKQKPKPEVKKNIKDKPKTIKKMTIEDLRANHPEVYNKVFNLGSEAGIATETDRVGAWLTFVDVDAETVSKGIKDGEQLSNTAMAELSRKQFSKEVIADVKADNADDIDPVDPKPEAGAKSESEVELDALLNLDKN